MAERIGGSFTKGFASAMDDIRHKYEEVMYGRETTGNLEVVEIEKQNLEEPEQKPFTMAEFYGDPNHDDLSYSEPTQEQDIEINNDIER